MRVLVTGAGGFIGARLVEVLRARGRVRGNAVSALALADQKLPRVAGALALEGDLGAPAMLRRIAEFAPDVVFHLAAVPGGAAEADYALGRRVNLDATLALFESLAALPRGEGHAGQHPHPNPLPRAGEGEGEGEGEGGREAERAPAVVVYASTIAVYGQDLPDRVTSDTPLRPPLTYGAHKLACEILLADFSRRGLLDGRSVRLPGIVARPRAPSGLASAFMSDLLHALAAGERYTCPVSPDATAWWMSAWRCAENLVHAAEMDVDGADRARAWPLPVLRLSIAQVVDTLASIHGADRRELVDYAPQPALEAVFGRYPVLDDAPSRALGLRDDGSAEAMVRRALAPACGR